MNVFKVITTEFALNDLTVGRAFYNKQSKELGDYFFDSLIADIESLSFYAGIHSQENGFYRILSKRFPYSIYYHIISDDTAEIVAVFDQRKNPALNYEELESR